MIDTTTPEVKELGKMHFEGNIIPHTWYKTILLRKDKADILSILILADIVYWYRPSYTKDEATGDVTRMDRRFKEDMLQRTYESLGKQFNVSARQAREAIIRLENRGIIKRDQRTIVTKTGITLNNIVFIRIFPKVLALYTYKPFGITWPKPTCHENSCHTPQNSDTHTNEKMSDITENTPENTIESYTLNDEKTIVQQVKENSIPSPHYLGPTQDSSWVKKERTREEEVDFYEEEERIDQVELSPSLPALSPSLYRNGESKKEPTNTTKKETPSPGPAPLSDQTQAWESIPGKLDNAPPRQGKLEEMNEWARKSKMMDRASDIVRNVSFLVFAHSGIQPSGSLSAWTKGANELWNACGGNEAVLVKTLQRCVSARINGRPLSLTGPRSFVKTARSIVAEGIREGRAITKEGAVIQEVNGQRITTLADGNEIVSIGRKRKPSGN